MNGAASGWSSAVPPLLTQCSTPGVAPLPFLSSPLRYFLPKSGMGYRKGRGFHFGIDLSAPTGTMIYAMADGDLAYVQDNPGLKGAGRWLGIESRVAGGRLLHRYMHLSQFAPGILPCVLGQRCPHPIHVVAGQLIGFTGQTGAPGQPHLHIELGTLAIAAANQKWFSSFDITTCIEPIEVSVRAYIDGRSTLLLTAGLAQWHHLDFAAPGRWQGQFQPTTINSDDWFPSWPDLPTPENRDCSCFSSVRMPADPSCLRPEDVVIAGDTLGNPPDLRLLSARGPVTVTPIGRPALGYEVEMDDRVPSGADWYDFTLVLYPWHTP